MPYRYEPKKELADILTHEKNARILIRNLTEKMERREVKEIPILLGILVLVPTNP